MLVITIWNFLKSIYSWFNDTFRKPKLRVRAVDLKNGKFVYGTVEKTMLTQRPHAPEPWTYWTIVWDDTPGVWKTIPTANFIWYDGYHTLIER
jgi:hypothetical protein